MSEKSRSNKSGSAATTTSLSVERRAREAVEAWSAECGGVLNNGSPAGKRLIRLVAAAIQQAVEDHG